MYVDRHNVGILFVSKYGTYDVMFMFEHSGLSQEQTPTRTIQWTGQPVVAW